jgi:hypothetical protein
MGFMAYLDAPPHSLKYSNANPKVETIEEEKVEVCFLVHNTSRVKGHVGASRWGLG